MRVEKEELAVLFALRKFRFYFLPLTSFVVLTDHLALKYAFQEQDIHDHLARWLDTISKYHFSIGYRARRHNGAADFLLNCRSNGSSTDKDPD